eukprot:scaffold24250_cov61-Attheya_sp.AAC.10
MSSFLLKNWDIIAPVAQGMIKRLATYNTQYNQIAADIQRRVSWLSLPSTWLQTCGTKIGAEGTNNWTRSLPEFDEYEKSLDILADNKEKQVQNDKRHFDLWVNKCLFLTIYSEAETAQVAVMQFLLDNKDATGFAMMNGMYESKMHSRTITLHLNCESFSNPEQQINLHCLSLHMMPIHQGVVKLLTLEETCDLKQIVQPVLLSIAQSEGIKLLFCPPVDQKTWNLHMGLHAEQQERSSQSTEKNY